ncbi:putative mitochondrial protein [Cardamine amara subsp. amara]|uniref:Mitochondrial protein n=1 Tax=Cardamine amara subsp. amara TaxID=228776 RepID=A0ABD1BQ55_CARAN
MEECAPVTTPLPLKLYKDKEVTDEEEEGKVEQVEEEEKLFSDPTYFRSLAGKLQYLTLTRPDIQFAVNFVCQKMHAPTVTDFDLLKRILRYIRGTVTMGIKLNNNTDCKLRAYSDSDWAGCHSTRRSTGGYCTFLGNNLISWSSRKHDTVSKSSTRS